MSLLEDNKMFVAQSIREKDVDSGNINTKLYYELGGELSEVMRKDNITAVITSAMLLPMVVKPKPYTQKLIGGYLTACPQLCWGGKGRWY